MMLTYPSLLSGAIVTLPDGSQAVVRHAWDGEPVEVIRHGQTVGEFFDPWLLTRIPVPGSIDVCLRCGAVWKRIGARTSHCPAPAGCCETFDGGELWDAHRVQRRDGRTVCLAPGSMVFRGERLRKITDQVPGLVLASKWRGPRMPVGVFDDDSAPADIRPGGES